MFFKNNQKKKFINKYKIPEKIILEIKDVFLYEIDKETLLDWLKEGKHYESETIKDFIYDKLYLLFEEDKENTERLINILFEKNMIFKEEMTSLNLTSYMSSYLIEKLSIEIPSFANLSTKDVQKFLNKKIKDVNEIKEYAEQNYLSDLRSEPLYRCLEQYKGLANMVLNKNPELTSEILKINETFVFEGEKSLDFNVKNLFNPKGLIESLKKENKIVLNFKTKSSVENKEVFIGDYIVFPFYRKEVKIEIEGFQDYEISISKSDNNTFDLNVYDLYLKREANYEIYEKIKKYLIEK
jgi:hypothetical protein